MTLTIGLVEFLVFCLATSLIVSGTLRLTSLIKNSESAGLQLLGPENIAIVKVRLTSIIFSAIYELILVFYFDVHSGLFDLFHMQDSDSIVLGISKNIFKILCLIPVFASLIINFIIELYQCWTLKKMTQAQHIIVYSIQQDSTAIETNKRVFSFPGSSTIEIPLTCLISILFSFGNRKLRLTIFCPLQLMLMSIVVPWLIIIRNKKVRTFFMTNWINPAKNKIRNYASQLKLYWLISRSNSVQPLRV